MLKEDEGWGDGGGREETEGERRRRRCGEAVRQDKKNKKKLMGKGAQDTWERKEKRDKGSDEVKKMGKMQNDWEQKK